MPKDVIDRVHELAAAEKVSQGLINSEGEDIFEPAMHLPETAGVDVSYESAGGEVSFENAENAGVDVSEDFAENAGVDVSEDFGEKLGNVSSKDIEKTGVDVSENEIENGSDNAKVDENLDYAKSLDELDD